jgi:hypothetical protein
MKKLILITIPLAFYHEKIYWCLHIEHSGKVREDLLNRPTGGKQIPFAFEKALTMEGDILILTDDKFGFEKGKQKGLPSDSDIEQFLTENPLPKTWLTALEQSGNISRVLLPDEKFMCTTFTYSEKKLLSGSKATYFLPGECANEWALLLDYLQHLGYTQIHAFIPQVCAKGICYATPYATDTEIWTHPITIDFTEKEKVAATYNFNS